MHGFIKLYRMLCVSAAAYLKDSAIARMSASIQNLICLKFQNLAMCMCRSPETSTAIYKCSQSNMVWMSKRSRFAHLECQKCSRRQQVERQRLGAFSIVRWIFD